MRSSILLGIAIAILAGTLSACGIEAASNSGSWMDGPNGTRVWCVGNSNGGLSCDWDGMHKGNVR